VQKLSGVEFFGGHPIITFIEGFDQKFYFRHQHSITEMFGMKMFGAATFGVITAKSYFHGIAQACDAVRDYASLHIPVLKKCVKHESRQGR
jgi:hypothetical protein